MIYHSADVPAAENPCDQSELTRPPHPFLRLRLPSFFFYFPHRGVVMSSLSPPPVRNRASSTNLRPALTISTLGPRPKACAFLDPVPASPQVTAEMRKVAPSLASPSRLSSLIERSLALLHVYSHLPSYSTPSSPLSPSEDSVLPMSTTTTSGDDVEEKHSTLLEGPKSSPLRPWFRTIPSVC